MGEGVKVVLSISKRLTRFGMFQGPNGSADDEQLTLPDGRRT
jgi:hypothetical protein